MQNCVFCGTEPAEIELFCLNCVPRCGCCQKPTAYGTCGLSSFHCIACECFCPICGNSCTRHKYTGDPNNENYRVSCPAGCDDRLSLVDRPDLLGWNEYGHLEDPLNQANGVLFCRVRLQGTRAGEVACDVQ